MLRKVFAAVLFGILSLSCTTAGERTAPSPPAARCSAARTLEAPFRCHFFELDKAAYQPVEKGAIDRVSLDGET